MKSIQTTDKVQYQEQLENSIETFLANYTGARRVSCAEAAVDLLGGDMRPEDQIFEMRHGFLDLLTLLADPEVSAKLQKIRSGYTKDHAEYLRRAIVFCTQIDNAYGIAEMHRAYLVDCQYEISQLEGLHRLYQNESQPALSKAA